MVREFDGMHRAQPAGSAAAWAGAVFDHGLLTGRPLDRLLAYVESLADVQLVVLKELREGCRNSVPGPVCDPA
jgi:hypothetical protein